MYLKRLTVTNFKNYEVADFSFSEKINCFVGNNGVGKTNILDAVHYLSFCKSYFTTIDTQNIRHGEDFLRSTASISGARGFPIRFSVSKRRIPENAFF